jgi:hypothetical protein
MELHKLKQRTTTREISPGVTVCIVKCSACHAPLHVEIGRPIVETKPLCLECARDVVKSTTDRVNRLFYGAGVDQLTPEAAALKREATEGALGELWQHAAEQGTIYREIGAATNDDIEPNQQTGTGQ